MLARNHFTTHVIDTEADQLIAGCEENILQTLDPSRLNIDTTDFIDGAIHKCGIGTSAWSMVLGFDNRGFTDIPSSWNSIWNTLQFPGGRSLFAGPETTLEIALLADDVPISSIYAQLRTQEGITRAFDKLNVIKNQVVWWEFGNQPAQLLMDREVVLTSGWHGRLVTHQSQGVKIIWDNQLLYFDYWAVPKGHPENLLSYQFIAFAIRPDRQAHHAQLFPYGPTRKSALRLLSDQRLPLIPTAPRNVASALRVDPKFWHDKRIELQARFNRWLHKQ